MPTKSVDPPIFKAIKKKDIKKVLSLINQPDYDANQFNSMGLTPLYASIVTEDMDLIKLLLQPQETDVNFQNPYNGRTAIFYCIDAGSNAQPILSLINNHSKLDLNCQDHFGNTALHLTSAFNSENIAETLIRLNSNIDTCNNEQVTPLLQAIISNSYETAILLIKNGADLYKADKHGHSALSLALKSSNENMIRIILDALSQDKQFHDKVLDENGNTPLHIAAQNKATPKVLKLLEDKGFKWETTNKAGQTPRALQESQRLIEEQAVQNKHFYSEIEYKIKRDLIDSEKKMTEIYKFCTEYSLPERFSDILFNKNFRKIDDSFFSIGEKQLLKWGASLDEISLFSQARESAQHKSQEQALLLEEIHKKKFKAVRTKSIMNAFLILIIIFSSLYILLRIII